MEDEQLKNARRMFDYAIAVIVGMVIGFFSTVCIMIAMK